MLPVRSAVLEQRCWHWLDSSFRTFTLDWLLLSWSCSCGNDHAHMVDHMRRLTEVTSHQVYPKTSHVGRSLSDRRLGVTESYDTTTSGDFLPIANASAAGLTRNIRIKVRRL